MARFVLFLSGSEPTGDMNMRITLTSLLLACGMGIGSAQAAMLQVSAGGELTGALGVNVGGTLFNVQFVEGTCAALFSGCSDFAFTTEASADQASQELLNQVFLGTFDTQPSLTIGCELSTVCGALTPFGVIEGEVLLSSANNSVVEVGDIVADVFLGPGTNTTMLSNFVFARWSLAQTVPASAPGALSLMALGLVGLAWSRRRNP